MLFPCYKRVGLTIAALALGCPSLGGPIAALPAAPQGRLSAIQTAGIPEKLKAFAPQRFWIVLETAGPAPRSEPENFAHQVEEQLRSAGWVKTRTVWQKMGDAGFRKVEMQDYSKPGDSSVFIVTPLASKHAAKMLSSTLRQAGIASSFELDENLRGAILFFIGPI
jgi:hypothetical protein